jgi:hypothetical protein
MTSAVFATTTITRTYTIQDKLFKPKTHVYRAKALFYTTTGRVIYYYSNSNWEDDENIVAKIYFSIKIGGRYTFTLEGNEIKFIEGITQ